MESTADLVNKGFIVNQASAARGRTFMVTGLQRSGTTLVASILHHLGIFIGSEINDIVFEDEAMARVLAKRDPAALHAIIAERNAQHQRWGFKYPMLNLVLQPEQFALFDRPRLIVTFRDPVAMAVRQSLSEYLQPADALRKIAAEQAELMAFVDRIGCPNLLLSYEKALSFPEDFIDTILQFCGIPPIPEVRALLMTQIEPGRPRYLVGARRRFEGVIEGIYGEQLYGWCRLTHTNDPVTLDVSVDDVVVAQVVADSFRRDLLNEGIGAGSHGFFIDLAALQAQPESVIRVRVASHGIEIANSGKRFREFTRAA